MKKDVYRNIYIYRILLQNKNNRNQRMQRVHHEYQNTYVNDFSNKQNNKTLQLISRLIIISNKNNKFKQANFLLYGRH